MRWLAITGSPHPGGIRTFIEFLVRRRRWRRGKVTGKRVTDYSLSFKFRDIL